MKLLLINKNPAISRLIGLSAYKLGYELTELFDFELKDDERYDAVFVDSDIFTSEVLMSLNEVSNHIVYIGARGSEKPLGVDIVLEKPCLPPDFIAIANNIL